MKQKTAIITGASRGIGRAVSLYLAKQGYYTILIARREQKLSELVNKINNEFSGAEYHTLDITDKQAVKEIMNEITSKFESIDILFNSAGILKFGTLETSHEDIEKMININLLGTIYITNLVADFMKQQGSGYIFNMSSMSGKRALPLIGMYSASKFGVTGYNEALFNELSQYGVKVTAICPSLIATDMTEDFYDKVPPEKMINMENIVNTVDYLLSLDSTALIKDIEVNKTS